MSTCLKACLLTIQELPFLSIASHQAALGHSVTLVKGKRQQCLPTKPLVKEMLSGVKVDYIRWSQDITEVLKP